VFCSRTFGLSISPVIGTSTVIRPFESVRRRDSEGRAVDQSAPRRLRQRSPKREVIPSSLCFDPRALAIDDLGNAGRATNRPEEILRPATVGGCRAESWRHLDVVEVHAYVGVNALGSKAFQAAFDGWLSRTAPHADPLRNFTSVRPFYPNL